MGAPAAASFTRCSIERTPEGPAAAAALVMAGFSAAELSPAGTVAVPDAVEGVEAVAAVAGNTTAASPLGASAAAAEAAFGTTLRACWGDSSQSAIEHPVSVPYTIC